MNRLSIILPLGRTILAFFAFTLLLPATLPVRLIGAPIPKLFNTGVGDDGKLLPASTIDSHYKLTTSDDPDSPGPNTSTLKPGFPVGPWLEEGPNSRWIAPKADQSGGNAPGNYTYTTTFDLTGLDP